MRVVLSGGGSAGHITPTLAVSDALHSLVSDDLSVLYLGQAGSMEERIVRARGLAFAPVRAGKFRRNHFDRAWAKVLNAATLGPNARDAVRMVAGVADAVKALRAFKPDVVFIKGGFVGVPVGLAARILGIPYVIHESDVVPGLANRLLGRWATKVAVGFPVKGYRDFAPERMVYVGNPVRAEVVRAHRLEGLAKFGLDENLPVVLVTGGSQGAAQINDSVISALPELLSVCQVIHLTGEGEFGRLEFESRKRDLGRHGDRYHPYAFLLDEMPVALAAADIVVSRAGVNTIAELAILGKPTILIPNYQMAGHQVANARVLSRAGAARVLDGRTLTPEKLTAEIKGLLADEAEQQRLGVAIKRFGKADAAMALAEVVVAAVRRSARAQRSDQNPNTEEHDG